MRCSKGVAEASVISASGSRSSPLTCFLPYYETNVAHWAVLGVRMGARPELVGATTEHRIEEEL